MLYKVLLHTIFLCNYELAIWSFLDHLIDPMWIKFLLDEISLYWTCFFTQILFFGCNFSTRNIRKLIKGLKSSDYSLVSTKRLGQKLALAVDTLGTGPCIYGRNCTQVTRPHMYMFWTKILVLWPWDPKQCAIFMAQVFFGN